ncbi:bifunctional hydroxymethylpyrimidine kinase/phosphomethylpyrimidine kinase [Natronorubrum daqingense]|uniref:Bifunctional hydroxymethylpyrimidine kinase/phosphomethylpyrimidine kinase n=1 Tax=Natronorubrum daqingense TaxID=588898 RepID=A0A1N7CL89_9EURY|nr:bifunctional hydroxymethylpyrimidine kinase/phosphomethylpyrimidine kinase [Natronorubrum daqingense]APX96954.1 bifunctional hydroxymethylpyrimidine kinase/phosphomethylpyrimidine kinase [Natronorubrum daqingense]SIR64349.1 hydroxymethylpyrimidine/phosphomethylpyrimidine kinase [Natronorubrum daqingense]
MRTSAPDSRPVALTIAGSDSGGGAGIQADLATMAAHGVFGTSAITAVTAQHTRGVDSSFTLPRDEVVAQLEAVTTDFAVGAAKTGMLATTEIVQTVADHAESFDFPLVVDPVMVATSGDRLLEPEAERAYEALLGEATVATPNADEAEVLTGIEVTDEERAREAGEEILETGVDAALVKGGHVPGDRIRDVLVTGEGVRTFEHPRVDTEATHGSGCTLAASIASRLARGDSLEAAVEGATAFLERAVRYHSDVGGGPGAVNHLVDLRNEAAREPTAEAVQGVVDRFVERDVSPLVPEVGMNVVGATPSAETVEETAAVEGRIARTLSGVQPNRGVRFGASSHVARFLLSAREFFPELRFAVNCRFGPDVDDALEALEWSIAGYDRADEPAAGKSEEGHTMGWGARQAFGGREEPPVAVIDRGDVGKEAMAKLVASDPETLVDRVIELTAEVGQR